MAPDAPAPDAPAPDAPAPDASVTDGPVVLRTATSLDIPTVLDLWVTAGAHPTSTDDAPSLTGLLARDADALILAEMDGTVVGSLIATWDGWRGNMYRLAVLPAVRRRGVAAALVGHAERRLRHRGCRRVTALVAEADPGAVDFWSAVDYVPYPMERYVHTLGDAGVQDR